VSNSLGRRAIGLAALGTVALGGFAASALGAGNVIRAEDQAPPILNNLSSDGATVVGARTLIGTIYEHFLTTNAKGEYIPLLATTIPSGKDVRVKGGKMYVTVNIQPKAAWSDGKPVTSQDMVYLNSVFQDKNNQLASRTGWDQIERIQVQGPKKFTMIFKKPYAAWKDVISTSGGYYLLPSHLLKGKDFNTVLNNGGPLLVGSGPYKLKSYTADEFAELVPNPNYWDKAKTKGPKLSKIRYNYVGNTTTQAVQFKSGEANMIEPPPDFDLINQIAADNPNGTVQAKPGASWEHIAINVSKPPFDDPLVRQALAYALDRKGVTDTLLKGVVKRLDSAQLFPFMTGYYKPVFAKYTYQPNKAKALLQQAGWTIGGDGIATKGGQKLSVPIKTTAGNQARLKNIQFLLTKAKAAGFDLSYAPEPASKLFGGTLTDGDFQLAEFAYLGSADPSITGIFSTKQIPTAANEFSGQNVYRLSDPKADRLMDQADAAINVKQRQKLTRQLQDVLAQDVPAIPLYERPEVAATKKVLLGVQPNPTQTGANWNVAAWFVKGARA
jgi:peptide/nickel transport system substrate-binding protein